MYTCVQNVIELSAAVLELSYAQRKKNSDENNTVMATADRDSNN